MNYQKKTGRFPSSSPGEIVTYYTYVPATTKPRGILQIAHGMCEYIERYEPFIEFLMEKEWIVCGNDHLGHGKTAAQDSDYGYMGGSDGWKHMVEDMHSLTRRMKQLHPDMPYILLAHSMGSFLGRAYLTQYGTELTGAIIMGTGSGIGRFPSMAASGLVRLMTLFRGERYRSPLLQKLVFGAYNKRILDPATDNDWLSRDPETVRRYEADPLCTFTFTLSGFANLLGVLRYVSSPRWAEQTPGDLPMLVVSGDADPVGNYGAGPRKVALWLKQAGAQDVSLKLYPDYRHEPLNEVGREQVYEDLLAWMEEHICRKS